LWKLELVKHRDVHHRRIDYELLQIHLTGFGEDSVERFVYYESWSHIPAVELSGDALADYKIHPSNVLESLSGIHTIAEHAPFFLAMVVRVLVWHAIGVADPCPNDLDAFLLSHDPLLVDQRVSMALP